MLAMGMRYHGVRVWDRYSARFGAGLSLDTAAWLLFLDRSLLARIGADRLSQVDSRVHVLPRADGILLQAGDEPDACDVEDRGDGYSLLASVDAFIAPLRTQSWLQGGWAAHDPAEENAWFSRMEPGNDGVRRQERER